jgi:hypothetical protein
MTVLNALTFNSCVSNTLGKLVVMRDLATSKLVVWLQLQHRK